MDTIPALKAEVFDTDSINDIEIATSNMLRSLSDSQQFLTENKTLGGGANTAGDDCH